MTRGRKRSKSSYTNNNRFTFPSPEPMKFASLYLENVAFAYEKEALFKNVNLSIDLSSRIAIVGSNGLGKSTLLNIIYGNLTPTAGEVNRNRRLRIAKYSQHNYEQLDYEASCVDFLMDKHHINKQTAHKVLGSFGVPSHAHRSKLAELSGGEKAKVRFADIACSFPDIIIFDEPTVHLDVFSVESLIEAINKFAGGVVLVSHDQALIRDTNCKLFVLENKQLCEFYGNFDDYKTKVLREIMARD